MAKKCNNPKCQYNNLDSSHYCVKCGHPLEEKNWMDFLIKVRPKDKVKIYDTKNKEYTVISKDEYNALIDACNESDKKINDLNRRLRLSNRSWYEKLNEKLKKWWNDSGEAYFYTAVIIIGIVGFILMGIDACESTNAKENEKEIILIKQDEKSKKYGLYDNKRDSLIVPCQYDSIFRCKGNHEQNNWIFIYLKSNGKWGVADSMGRITVNCELDSVKGNYDGLMIMYKGRKQGILDYFGQPVVPCNYLYVLWVAKPREDLYNAGTYVGDIIPVKAGNNSGWELYNRKGIRICDKKYHKAIQTGSPELIKVCERVRGRVRNSYSFEEKYGVVDENGQEVIPCKYYGISKFGDDRAWVQEKEGGAWSLIASTGKLIKTNLFQSTYTPYAFSEGLAAVKAPNGKIGYYDVSGNLAQQFKYMNR